MTPKYVRTAFKQAGFPLRPRGNGCSYDYSSSVVNITFCEYRSGNHTLTVRVGYSRNCDSAYCTSVAQALRIIRGRMAMDLVWGNDFALNTGPRGQLRLVEGEAA